MRVFETMIALCWLSLLAYWLISAGRVKRNRQGVAWLREAVLRVAVVLALGLLLKSPVRLYAAPTTNPALAGIGVALCGAGIACAIWARACLGRNWGFPMTVKAEPELVAHGPYAVVRHPIYAGILVAQMGTALVIGPLWLVVVAVFGGYFWYSATREEQLMTQAFPQQYPAYQQRTKRLIPFLY